VTKGQTSERVAAGGERHDGKRPQAQVVLGLLVAPGMVSELAGDLVRELPDRLAERFPEVSWDVTAREESMAAASASTGGVDLVEVARRKLLEEGWDLAICLTDQPLLVDRRPVTAHASVSHGVGLVSVPALGAVGLEERTGEAVLNLVERILGERFDRHGRETRPRGRRARLRGRLHDLSSAVGRPKAKDDNTVRFMTAVVRGNLRLLMGMIRANRPWRLAAGLSRALTGALGTAAFGLASTGIWHIADGLPTPRIVALCLAAVLVTSAALIVVHDLWERSPSPEARERVALFNLATTITIFLGTLSLLMALVAITLACGVAIIVSGVLESELQHGVDIGDYLQLAAVVSMLATLGGGLGSALESDNAVRQAAYGYHPDE
jgi:hypothetical protein